MAKITLKNAFYFNQGYIRMFLYNFLPFLMRKHIKEQYEYRRDKTKLCTENGSCLACGCKTPELYFANKGCSSEELSLKLREKIVGRKDVCYTKMLSKKEWKNYLIKTN